MESTWLQPGRVDEDALAAVIGQGLRREASLAELLRRPGVDYRALAGLVPGHAPLGNGADDEKIIEQLEVEARYSGYLQRQEDEIERTRRHENTPLPASLDYGAVRGLSWEVRQKLADARPATLGQAGRVSGVTPAAVSLLLVHLKKNDMLAA